jgi:Protein of unknown function (DUF3102)
VAVRRNPAARGASRGSGNVQLGSEHCGNSTTPHHGPDEFVARRFGVSPQLATILAQHAFEGEGGMSATLLVHNNFDYNILAPDIASMAAAAVEIRTSTSRQITEVVASGKLLLTVKAALPHGTFGKWLVAEFGWTERTAQNYMRAAETYGSNTKCVSDLPLKTIYQLQAPTVPESVRADVFSMAERGERPTEVAVKTMIAEAKWKRDEERREAADQAERAKRSLRSSKKYKERKAAEREAAQAEAEKRAAEERAAAQQAAELVSKALPAPDVQVLIASIEKSGAWLFNNALRQIALRQPPRERKSKASASSGSDAAVHGPLSDGGPNDDNLPF